MVYVFYSVCIVGLFGGEAYVFVCDEVRSIFLSSMEGTAGLPHRAQYCWA